MKFKEIFSIVARPPKLYYFDADDSGYMWLACSPSTRREVV
jgi:hypothetical protein